MKIDLREWQNEAYEAFKKNNFNGILKVGTGKGKTVFAIYCINQLQPNRTCIIVPTINLMFQWQEAILKFSNFNEEDIGLYYGKEKDYNKPITIFIVNSAVKEDAIKKIHEAKPFQFMIADECHHYGSNIFSKIFKVKAKYSLGLSATPERDDEGTERLEKGLGKKVFELNHLDDPSSIPHFTIWSILVDLNDDETSSYEKNKEEISKLNNYITSKYNIDKNDPKFPKLVTELAEKNDFSAKKLLSLWFKQADIKHKARSKLPTIKELVDMEKESKIIIFNERIAFSKEIYEELIQDSSLNIFLVHSELKRMRFWTH